ncbi:hypothetical protein M3Y97_00137100 [Aphelenchoides bicaudatus]|nr:hypothetical protein M3Y97_00137100 [Aphelenchoides bicaudatus]
MLYDTKTNQIIDWYKRQVPNNDGSEESQTFLISIDSRPILTVDKLEARQFVISEPLCVYILFYDPISQMFHFTTEIKDLKNERRATSISFGPETNTGVALPREEPVRLAIGYSTGELEMYGVRYEHDAESFKAQLVAVAPAYSSQDNKPSAINRLGWSHRWNMLFAGTSNGIVVHFDHVNLEKSRKPRY